MMSIVKISYTSYRYVAFAVYGEEGKRDDKPSRVSRKQECFGEKHRDSCNRRGLWLERELVRDY